MTDLRKSLARSSTGAVSTLVLSLVVACAFFVCSCAFDLAHISAVKRDLKKAADSAALAGAEVLAREPITMADCDEAVQVAFRKGASYTPDNIPLAPNSPDTTVSVSVNTSISPRTATVKISRMVANTFLRNFGIGAQEVRSEATAWAFKGVTTLSPGQAYPIALMLDHAPKDGAQAGMALAEYTGAGADLRPFTIVLRSDEAQNAVWLDERRRPWIAHSIIFGQTKESVDRIDYRSVRSLTPGDRLLLPLIQSRPVPGQEKVVIIGVIAFEIAAVNGRDELIGYIRDPVVVTGKPGTPILSTVSDQDTQFLSQHSPWKVQLVQ